MSQKIIEADAKGEVHLTAEALGIDLRSRYLVQVKGETLVLVPPEETTPYWEATPEERASRFSQWASQFSGGQGLSSEALRRECIYIEN